MPARSSPNPRRVVIVVVSALVLVVGIALLTTFHSGFGVLGQRYATVHFKDGTSYAERQRVQAACTAPRIRPQAMGPDDRADARYNEIQYRVDDASDGDIATLSRCLKRYPSVLGIDLSDLTN
ncbi:MAG: hypothetical protein J2P14_11950 [Acidothermales bacterium]|nr:hypothetical protein [Acidothermales bacterium]